MTSIRVVSDYNSANLLRLGSIVVGRHGRKFVMIPYETKENAIVPVTVHATTRTQITFRLRTARFIHE